MVRRSDVIEAVAGVVFLAIVFVGIQWVTLSFTLTYVGPVKWSEGWQRTMCIYRECNDGVAD